MAFRFDSGMQLLSGVVVVVVVVVVVWIGGLGRRGEIVGLRSGRLACVSSALNC